MKEELARAKEDNEHAQQQRQKRKEAFSHTYEERLPVQDELTELTGARNADHAHHKRETKNQLVQTISEELLLEGDMGEERAMAKGWKMHDKITGEELAMVCKMGKYNLLLSRILF